MMGQAYQGDKVFKIETEDIDFRKTVEKVDQTLVDVRYEIEAICDDEIACRMRNDPPSPLTANDVYLHPGASGWETDESGQVSFEGKLSGNKVESVVVTYNIGKADGMNPLQPEPRIDIARPTSNGESNQYDSSIIIEQSEPPATVPLEIGNDELDETADVSNPSGEEDEQQSLTLNGHTTEDAFSDNADQRVGDSLVINRLLEELEDTHLSDEDQQRFRALLGVEEVSNEPESLRVKIDHIDRELSDLSAYREALAEFIDSNGSGRQVIDDMQDRFETIEDQFAKLESTLGEISETVTTVTTDLDAIDNQVQEHKNKLAKVRSQQEDNKTALTEALEANNAQLQDRLSLLQDEIEKLNQEVTQSREWRESLGEALRGES